MAASVVVMSWFVTVDAANTQRGYTNNARYTGSMCRSENASQLYPVDPQEDQIVLAGKDGIGRIVRGRVRRVQPSLVEFETDTGVLFVPDSLLRPGAYMSGRRVTRRIMQDACSTAFANDMPPDDSAFSFEYRRTSGADSIFLIYAPLTRGIRLRTWAFGRSDSTLAARSLHDIMDAADREVAAIDSFSSAMVPQSGRSLQQLASDVPVVGSAIRDALLLPDNEQPWILTGMAIVAAAYFGWRIARWRAVVERRRVIDQLTATVGLCESLARYNPALVVHILDESIERDIRALASLSSSLPVSSWRYRDRSRLALSSRLERIRRRILRGRGARTKLGMTYLAAIVGTGITFAVTLAIPVGLLIVGVAIRSSFPHLPEVPVILTACTMATIGVAASILASQVSWFAGSWAVLYTRRSTRSRVARPESVVPAT
jgi:hypothetical protein